MATRSIVAERDEAIIEFCTGGATMAEISEYVGIKPSSIGNYMARLQMEGRIEKVPPPKRQFGKGGVTDIFIKPGTELTHPPVSLAATVETGPVYNWDFIHVMHRILHLGAI